MKKKRKRKQIAKGTELFAGTILLSGLFFCVPVHAQDISIQDTFPDNEFKSYISENIDLNKDDYLSANEINAVKTITIPGRSTEDYSQVYSLNGIEVFSNLEYLNCSFNGLTDLDISKNTNLTTLNCSDNSLKKLDLSKNTNLTSLTCDFNQIETLDISYNHKLEYLSCSYNSIETLDISNNIELYDLYVDGNALTALNLRQNTKLNTLNCSENNITDLDVSNNTLLTGLFCSYNQLDKLDISKNTLLSRLSCSNNQLTSLDISNTAIDVYGLGCFDNVKHVTLTNNQLDVSTLSEKFNTSMIHSITGGTLKNNILTFESEQVEYDYLVGNSVYVTFTLVADNYDSDITDNSDIENPSDTNNTGGSGSNQSHQQTTVTPPSNTNKESIASGSTVTDNKTKATYKISSSAATGYTATYMKPNSKKAKTVTIPSTITVNGISCKVTSIAANAFKGQKKLKKVTFGANVTTIGKKAFFNCSSLKKITVKSKVLKKVGAKAFSKINSNAKVKVPKNKKKAYKKVFKKNTGITLTK